MSRANIDKLFRKKLERRSFPLEQKELDDVRAMIDLHNALRTKRSAFSLKWMWAALVPLAALLWWSVGTGDPASEVGADVAVDEQRQGSSPTASPEQAGSRTLSVESGGVAAEIDSSSRFTAPSGADRTSAVRSIAATTTTGAVIPEQQPTDPTIFQDAIGRRNDVEAHAGIPANSKASEVDGVERNMNRFADAVADVHYLQPLWNGSKDLTHMPEASTVNRATIDPSLLKDRAMGDLHFFGGPLAVRSVPAAGADVATGTGSLFGLEYRVKARSFSAATGIHYGTYGFQLPATANDSAVCNVRLEYVQVPLLAGYGVGIGRAGLLVQGGISCNFYFNSAGRYGVPPEQGGTLISDEKFRTTTFALLLRPMITYRATEQLGFTAGPVWTRQISSIALDGPLVGAQARSFGASLGITWHLQRSTF